MNHLSTHFAITPFLQIAGLPFAGRVRSIALRVHPNAPTAPSYRVFRRLFLRTLALVACLIPVATTAAQSPAVQSPAVYSDAESGFSIEAPPGWRQLGANAIALQPGARAGFVNPTRDNAFFVIVEFIPGGRIPPNEVALIRYIQTMSTPFAGRRIRSEPEPAVLAGRPALKASMSIATAESLDVYRVTSMREGSYYFSITSVADAKAGLRADEEHTSIARSARITKSAADVEVELSRTVSAGLPCLDSSDALVIARKLLERSTADTPVGVAAMSRSIMSVGRSRLSSAEINIIESLTRKGLATLSNEDSAMVCRGTEDEGAQRTISNEEQLRIQESLRRACAALSVDEIAALRRATMTCFRFGLAAYDEEVEAETARSRSGIPGGVPGGVPVEMRAGVPGGVPGASPTGVSEAGSEGSAGVPVYSVKIPGPNGLDARAKVRKQAHYPQLARDAGIEGEVVVSVLIDESGLPLSVSVVSGHPLLRDWATRAAIQWEFEPVMEAGVPVMASGFLTFKFQK